MHSTCMVPPPRHTKKIKASPSHTSFYTSSETVERANGWITASLQEGNLPEPSARDHGVRKSARACSNSARKRLRPVRGRVIPSRAAKSRGVVHEQINNSDAPHKRKLRSARSPSDPAQRAARATTHRTIAEAARPAPLAPSISDAVVVGSVHGPALSW